MHGHQALPGEMKAVSIRVEMGLLRMILVKVKIIYLYQEVFNKHLDQNKTQKN